MEEIETRWDAAVSANPSLTYPYRLQGKVLAAMRKATPERVEVVLDAIETGNLSNPLSYALAILRKPEPKAYTPPPPPPPLDLSPLTAEQKQSGRGLLAQLRSALDDTDNAKVTA